MPLKISLLLALCAFLVNLPNAASDSPNCGGVVGNNLKSPEWPNMHPHDIENCHYSVSIPSGKNMVVYFHFFDLESSPQSSCNYDRLDISGSHEQFKRCCGVKTNETYEVTGSYVNLNLKTDSSVTKQGYDLYFIPVDPLPSSADRKKRTFFKKKLNINSHDEAQDRRIKDAVKAFVETRGLKRAESESLEDKKPEMI